MIALSLSWRMFLRDWRAGELRLLMAGLVLAVAGISSVGFFVDRMRHGLERDARQLLGADLLIMSDRPLSEEQYSHAGRLHLQLARTVTFPSMAAGSQHTVLAAVKAVSAGYPLRGAVKTMGAEGGEEVMRDIPQAGTVWVDPQLLQHLNLAPGATMMLGEARFTIARVIHAEPDRGANFLSFAPRVMLRLDDLPQTGLIQPTSRVTHRLLLAGTPAQVSQYQTWFQANQQPGQRIETLENSRPEMRSTIDRAERFLALVGLLAALLAAVAVALAARRYTQRHLDTCAMLRCLGLTQRKLMLVFLGEFLLIGLAAALLGALLGYLAHLVLVAVLAQLVQTSLPAASLAPVWQALSTGMILLLGFALPPLLQLREAPPLRVLRRDLGPATAPVWTSYLAAAIAFIVLLLWHTGDAKLGVYSVAAFAAGIAVFLLLSKLGLLLLRPLHQLSGLVRRDSSWRMSARLALAAIRRRPSASTLQLLALAVGLMALLLLTMTRSDLLRSWRMAIAPDAPNHFLLNVQPEQRMPVQQLLARYEIGDATLYPMVRGRLIAVNDRPVQPGDYVAENAQRLVDREFNLSYMDQLPSHNRLAAGRWFAPDAAELSLEEGIAKTLALKLGDRLRFDIAGQEIEARVGNLRKVEWDSMRVNFFVIFPAAMLEDMPQNFISAFHLPTGQQALITELVQTFPNLTVLDTGVILRQVQTLLEQVIQAVEFLFLFTVVSGLTVIYAALASSRDERIREAALLRALGASARQLARAQMLEFVLLGALAGLMAALGATVVGWLLASRVFDFAFHFSPAVFAAGIAIGIFCATLSGWTGLRDVLKQPPWKTLRET